MRCPTISNAFQVSAPSLPSVQLSGKSRRSALRAAGVRAKSEIVSCKLCCIVPLESRPYFLREISSANNHGNGFAAIALRVLDECRYSDARRPLREPALLIAQQAHGGKNFVFVYQHRAINHIAADIERYGTGFEAAGGAL